jgi:hypothetical protein
MPCHFNSVSVANFTHRLPIAIILLGDKVLVQFVSFLISTESHSHSWGINSYHLFEHAIILLIYVYIFSVPLILNANHASPQEFLAA